MKVIKKLNNNAVRSVNESGMEIIITGKGIGYNVRTGDEIDSSKIEQVFCPEPKLVENYEDILSSMPLAYLDISSQIMKMAKHDLNITVTDNLFLNISDHIYSAVQNYKQGIQVPNYLLKSIKKIYPEEFNVGLKAINWVNNKFKVSLPVDEAGFLAFHFVDSTNGSSIDQASQIVQVLRAILNIIRYQTGMTFSNSTDYRRLIVHLKFFIKRILSDDRPQANKDNNLELLQLFQTKYPGPSLVVDNIMNFLQNQYHYEPSNDEKLYLLIHIENAIQRTKEDSAWLSASGN